MRSSLRTCWTAVLIIGLFPPLVIQAQPFGDTEVAVYDTDFLSAPDGPAPLAPSEPPLPAWIATTPDPEPLPLTLPPILIAELIP